jgi:hypothetical protein
MSYYKNLRHLNRLIIGHTILVVGLNKHQDLEMRSGHIVIGIKTKAAFYDAFVFMEIHFLK